MTITREVEIELTDLKDRELFAELEDRIESHADSAIWTDEHRKKLKSEVQSMVDKLQEIQAWLTPR